MERPSKVYVFTGAGKGKTTAAMGLAVTQALAGRRVKVVQFLKGTGYTGELTAAHHLSPYFSIVQFGQGCLIAAEIQAGIKKCMKCGQCFRGNRNPDNNFAGKAFNHAAQLLREAQLDMLVLDEVSHAVRRHLLDQDELLRLVVDRPGHVDIVLTGRHMPEKVLAVADQATECSVVKHPMSQGIDARRGIEY